MSASSLWPGQPPEARRTYRLSPLRVQRRVRCQPSGSPARDPRWTPRNGPRTTAQNLGATVRSACWRQVIAVLHHEPGRAPAALIKCQGSSRCQQAATENRISTPCSPRSDDELRERADAVPHILVCSSRALQQPGSPPDAVSASVQARRGRRNLARRDGGSDLRTPV